MPTNSQLEQNSKDSELDRRRDRKIISRIVNGSVVSLRFVASAPVLSWIVFYALRLAPVSEARRQVMVEQIMSLKWRRRREKTLRREEAHRDRRRRSVKRFKATIVSWAVSALRAIAHHTPLTGMTHFALTKAPFSRVRRNILIQQIVPLPWRRRHEKRLRERRLRRQQTQRRSRRRNIRLKISGETAWRARTPITSPADFLLAPSSELAFEGVSPRLSPNNAALAMQSQNARRAENTGVVREMTDMNQQANEQRGENASEPDADPPIRRPILAFFVNNTVYALRIASRVPLFTPPIYWMLQRLRINSERRRFLVDVIIPKNWLRQRAKRQLRRLERPLERRRFYVSIPLHVLRYFARRGNRATARRIIALVEATPGTSAQRERAFEFIFADDGRGLRLDNATVASFTELKSASVQTRKSVDVFFNSALRKLARHREIHVFMEPHARIPEFMTSPELKDAQFVVYSVAKRQSDVDLGDLASRVRMAPLRDQFPEISPEAEALHRFGRDLSQKGVEALHATGQWNKSACPKERLDMLAVGLEGRITHQLTLLECYRAAMATVPKGEPIVFLAASEQIVPRGLPFLLPAVDEENLFIAFAHTSPKIGRQFWAALERHILKTTDTPVAAREELKEAWAKNAAGADIAERVFRRLEERTELAERLGERMARRLRSAISGQRTLLIVYSVASEPYREALTALATRAARQTSRTTVLLHASTLEDPNLAPAVIAESTGENVFAYELSAAAPLLNWKLHKFERDYLVSFMRGRLEGELAYRDVVLDDLFTETMREYFETAIHLCIAGYVMGRNMSSTGLSSAIVAPSRLWNVRSIAAGLLDQEDKPKVLDVQALNVLRHAKYMAPMADEATVIDSVAADIYREYLGVDGDRIHITGTPQNDAFRARVEAVDTEKVIEKLGLDAKCRKRILFASQLQPFDRMRQIVEPLAELLAAHEDLELIVKMHPREGPDRVSSYRQVIEPICGLERVSFESDARPAEVIAASHICITIYSNMAREAAIAGKPVVLALFTGWEPPIRLDEEGLATGAHSVEEFKSAVIDQLSDRQREAADGGPMSPYFVKNPHLMRGDSAGAILSAADWDETEDDDDEIASSDAFIERTEEDRLALEMLGEFKSIDVALDKDVRPARLPPIFPRAARIRVYCNHRLGGASRGLLPASARFETSKFSYTNQDLADEAMSRANNLAERLVDEIIKVGGDSRIGEELQKLKYAIWLRVRPALIDHCRHAVNFERALKEDSEALVIAGHSREYLDWSAEQCRTLGITKPVFLLSMERDLTHKLTPLSDIPVTERTSKELGPGANPVEDEALKAALDNLDGWFETICETSFRLPDRPIVFVTTDWHLKTVPPSVTPILRQLAESAPHAAVIATNMRTQENYALKHAVGEAKQNSHCPSEWTTLDFDRFTEIYKKPSARSVKHFGVAVTARLLAFITEQELNPIVARAVYRTIKAFMSNWLPEMLAWTAYCRDAFARPGSVSLACPGRQWHAEIAHNEADDAGALSVTLQNAYMIAGYTYTKPTGQYVTAIDAWSKELFIDVYGVPEETIDVVSTPRFDYLAELTKLDPAKSRELLELPRDNHIVMFAAQEGLNDETKQITRALADLPELPDRKLTILIKLHPRSPTKLAKSLETAIAETGSKHDVRVLLETPISECLAASDVVLTIYSNVGIEAAIARKSLVVVKLTDDDLPVPLDKFDIGYTAKSTDDMCDAVVKYLTDEAFAGEWSERQSQWRENNPAMRLGDSTHRITQRIVQQIAEADAPHFQEEEDNSAGHEPSPEHHASEDAPTAAE